MEDNVRWAWGHIVFESCLEILSFEFGFDCFCQIVQMCAYSGTSGVINGVDSNLDFVRELEHWFDEGTFEQLISDFLTHD